MAVQDPVSQDIAAEALFGRTRRSVLALLFGNPEKQFYLRQIVRESGAGTGAVQRELAQLVRADLVRRSEADHHVYFSANPGSPVYDDLRNLVTKTMGVVGAVRRSLVPLSDDGRIAIAFIFGSVAAGRQTAESDVDLAVIGSVSLSALVRTLTPLQEQLGRAVNPTVYDAQEYRAKYRKGQHFVRRVTDGRKIMLIGSENDLSALVGE